MCDACEIDDPLPRKAVSPKIVRAARRIEAAMPGERVPDHAWAVYESQASGSLTWPQYQRIRTSYDAAYAAQRNRPYSLRMGSSARLACDEVG